EQPESGGSRSPLCADRTADVTGCDVHLRVAPHAGDLSVVRYGDGVARWLSRRDAPGGGTVRGRGAAAGGRTLVAAQVQRHLVFAACGRGGGAGRPGGRGTIGAGSRHLRTG